MVGMKVTGKIMIDLKNYIEESLLDDFDTLNKNIDDVAKKPFKHFLKSVMGGDWDGSIQTLMQIVGAQSTKFDKKPNRVKKGDVYVTFYKSEHYTELMKTKQISLHLSCSGLDMKKYAPWNHTGLNYINISPHNRTKTFSLLWSDDTPIESNYNGEWYLLNKEITQDAFQLLNVIGSYNDILDYIK